jgi:glycosyltransferase involved in cell wall biosynthesis
VSPHRAETGRHDDTDVIVATLPFVRPVNDDSAAASELAVSGGPAQTVRVLQVISGLFYGGGQRVVLDLLDQLPTSNSVDVQLCCLGDHAGSPLAPHAAVTIPYNGRYNHPAVLWKAAWELRHLLKQNRFDFVHTHGVDADLIGATALYGLDAKHLCHLHITPPDRRSETWKAAIRRRAFRFLTARKQSHFIAVSDFVRRQMIAYYDLNPNTITTVRNGVNLGEFGVTDLAKHKSDNFTVGTAARLGPMKGLEYLIDAVASLGNAGTPCELRIAGTGSHRQALEQLATKLGVAERVHFLGHVADMSRFYQELDVFVLPSLSEGLPLVVLESMAAGTPVVATNIAGTPEVLRDGVEGCLVPPASSDALSVALQRLAADHSNRDRLAAAGRARVHAEFGTDRVAREIANVYRRLMNDD